MTSQYSRDTPHSSDGAFVHAALIIDSDESLRNRLMPALRRSLADDVPVTMVVSPDTERLVRADLGERGDRMHWHRPDAFYQRLGFAFEGFRRFLAAHHAAGQRVHVVAEPDVTTGIDPAGPVDRAAAYLSYEAACNQVFARYGCPVTCLWDSRRHPTVIIENVRSLHNHEITETGDTLNTGYVPPADYLAGRNDIPLPPLPPAPDLDVALSYRDELGPLRAAVQSWAELRSFTPVATDDVVIAVGEVATNGLVHGAPPVRVRGWHTGGTLVIQVDDAGGRPLPPTAGYLPPSTRPEDQRGMWLARQLADVITAHTGAGVTSVRLHFPHEVTHRNQEPTHQR
jgi:anti-sigma regulatory factor (Ser/Thr protein kinase)